MTIEHDQFNLNTIKIGPTSKNRGLIIIRNSNFESAEMFNGVNIEAFNLK